MNTETGDTATVAILPEELGSLRGVYLCSNYDNYSNVELMTAESAGTIRILNLKANTEWFTLEPARGEIEAGGDQELIISLRSAAEDGLWNFGEGDYEGEIMIDFTGAGNGLRVPVYLRVDPLDSPIQHSRPPRAMGITSAYPNPFNSSTTITYNLPTQSLVTL